mgnify:CR=1 FL=1
MSITHTESTALNARVAERAETRLLIDGELRESTSGDSFPNISPATGKVLGDTTAAGPDAVLDGRGRPIPLIDPGALVRQAIADANAVRGDDDEPAGAPTPRDPTTGARVRLAFDGDTTLG